ncbi:MAG: hypothetical protein QOI10_4643 [Solirubrobacterales bacterium]|jgi:hypothetical protein|nr:hypothetical protein [Solirubrobacterales bacterium]
MGAGPREPPGGPPEVTRPDPSVAPAPSKRDSMRR